MVFYDLFEGCIGDGASAPGASGNVVIDHQNTFFRDVKEDPAGLVLGSLYGEHPEHSRDLRTHVVHPHLEDAIEHGLDRADKHAVVGRGDDGEKGQGIQASHLGCDQLKKLESCT